MSLPTSYNLLAKHPNPVYVETGVWRGDSIQQALDAGFARIIGIDNDWNCIEFCKSRFGSLSEEGPIKLFKADSVEYLNRFIKEISEPITFFLDAHWQFLYESERGLNPFPLLNELDVILKRTQRDTIIIDDWHIFYPDRVGYSKGDILNKLETAGYSWHHLANPVIDGILVARR